MWIESHTVLIRHRKTRELARALGLRASHAMGHLHALWHAVLEQKEDGDLTSWSAAFIADAADYDGDPEKFLGALQEHGWLDGKLVHDWTDYAGRFLMKRYSVSNREKLVNIWRTHGKQYGGTGPAKAGAAHGHRAAARSAGPATAVAENGERPEREQTENITNLPNQHTLTRKGGGKARELSVHDLKDVLAAKEEKAAAIQAAWASETGLGMTWKGEGKKAEWVGIRKEIKAVKDRIASMA